MTLSDALWDTILILLDYSVGENLYMLPSDMNLKIRSGTVGYNNKILVSDEKFSLGKMKMLT